MRNLYAGIISRPAYSSYIRSHGLLSWLLFSLLFLTLGGLAPALAQAPPGNALSFDGVNDYVQIPSNSATSFAGSDAFSIEAWVKPDSADGTIHTIVWKVAGTHGTLIYWLYLAKNNALGFGMVPNGGQWSFSSSSTVVVPASRWSHVAATKTGSSIQLYINGKPLATTTTGSTTYLSAPAGDGALTISDYHNNKPFKGSIDEVRIWNTARTPAQVAYDYKNVVATDTTGLVAYYRFDEGTAGENNSTATTLTDLTPNGNNGTLENFTLSGGASNWVESYAMVVPALTAATDMGADGFTVSWTAPAVGTVEKYYLDISTDADFSTSVSGYPKNVGNVLSYTVDSLAPDTRYYYRVRANKASVDNTGGYVEDSVTTSGVLYVNGSATGSGDGSSWTNAFTNLGDAISAASDSNLALVGSIKEIWVAKGTYLPTQIAGNGTTNRDMSFVMPKDVMMHGGFAGTEVSRDDRDSSKIHTDNETILSGDLGTVGSTSDNAYHVVIYAGDAGTGGMDGFTVSNGNGNGRTNITVNSQTTYPYAGGGMAIYHSSPAIQDCNFSGNMAGSSGAGIYMYNSSPTITNCSFSGNKAVSGGGMYMYNQSSPTIANCSFSGNTANYNGGAMYGYNRCSPVLTSCSFSENTATNNGGAMYVYYRCSPVLTSCSFSGNTAQYGGAVFNDAECKPSFINCIFSGNTATSASTSEGGAVSNSRCLAGLAFTNCTFAGNNAPTGGGVMYSSDCRLINKASSPEERRQDEAAIGLTRC